MEKIQNYEKIIKRNKWKYTKSIGMPAYIGWPRGGGVPQGSEWHYKNFLAYSAAEGGGRPRNFLC